MALHPADDRLAHAAAVSGDRGRVEARTTVADEDVETIGGGLCEDVHNRAATELRRVHHRLARCRDKRLSPLIERNVSDADDFHARTVVALDLARRSLERGAERHIPSRD